MKNRKYFLIVVFISLIMIGCGESSREKQIRLENEEISKYENNSLFTGATPYRDYYGENEENTTGRYSKITVITQSGGDAIVIIKKNDNVKNK